MAKMVTVSLAEACAAVKFANTQEEVSAALEVLKESKDGTAERKAEARREAEAQESADKAANAFYNGIVVGSFDEIHNALEEAVEEFDQTDNESDAPETFVREINNNHVSILEIKNGFEVGFNGEYAIVEDLSGKSLMQLARYFNHR